MTKVIKITIRL